MRLAVLGVLVVLLPLRARGGDSSTSVPPPLREEPFRSTLDLLMERPGLSTKDILRSYATVEKLKALIDFMRVEALSRENDWPMQLPHDSWGNPRHAPEESLHSDHAVLLSVVAVRLKRGQAARLGLPPRRSPARWAKLPGGVLETLEGIRRLGGSYWEFLPASVVHDGETARFALGCERSFLYGVNGSGAERGEKAADVYQGMQLSAVAREDPTTHEWAVAIHGSWGGPDQEPPVTRDSDGTLFRRYQATFTALSGSVPAASDVHCWAATVGDDSRSYDLTVIISASLIQRAPRQKRRRDVRKKSEGGRSEQLPEGASNRRRAGHRPSATVFYK